LLPLLLQIANASFISFQILSDQMKANQYSTSEPQYNIYWTIPLLAMQVPWIIEWSGVEKWGIEGCSPTPKYKDPSNSCYIALENPWLIFA
jgi:hypothetical protein